MAGENAVISLCYFIISAAIAYSIWRNRKAGIDPIVFVMSCIFFSCALGHSFHAIGMLGHIDVIAWQVVADLTTVIIAVCFLSFYRSIDLLARFSQIVASQIELKIQNKKLEEAMEELKNAQVQLVKTEKMSSLGQLVAGIAHEINNPVSFIHTNLYLLEDYIQDLLDFVQMYQYHYPNTVPEIAIKARAVDLEFIQKDIPNMLSSMKIGTERISKIVLSLRNFSRLDEAELKPVDIHEGIDNTLEILQHRLKDNANYPAIQVSKEYSNLPLVQCYAGHLNQVFMSILVNAIDAIEEANAKRTYSEIKSDPSQITIRTSLIDAQWIQIAIADNGSGIPEKIKPQIFDPFFTTKAVGKGTGMGMSISYQIITKKHGGKLEFLSTLGEGTEFIITIPVRIK
ncbi:MAG: HAMP domain-containing histidine kinase [Scytonematopsis contorta HA4267-MV1]|jgi:signal transduction histidine kinase|nr:HAMP domain-containing histidine kinase [Scytonematopsis contorta HA4267-MV1]